MIKKFALYPFAARVTDFRVGQAVQWMITSHYGSSFVGTVIGIFPATDKVHVQWPHQVGQHSPEDLLPVSDALGVRPTVVDLLSPSVANQGLPQAAQVQVLTAHLKKSASVMKAAFINKGSNLNEVDNFNKVSSMFGDQLPDNQIRMLVSSLYDREKAKDNAVYLTVVYDLMHDA